MKRIRPYLWFFFWAKNWVLEQRARRGRAFYLRYIGPFLILWLLSLYHYSASNPSSAKSITANYIVIRKPLTNELSSVEATAQVDRDIERFLKRWNIPAASVAIVRDERLVYAKGFGYTDETQQQLTDPNHLFRIASASKLVTAAAVMRLADEGKLNLDHKVFGNTGYLQPNEYGEAWQQRVYDITVRHLLEHTSGFSWRTLGDPAFNVKKVASALEVPLPISRKQLIRWQIRQHLPYRPGTRYNYSNVGYMMLHEVVAEVSGMTYEEYVQRHVLKPAGIRGMRLGKNLVEDRHDDEVTYLDHEGAPWRQSVTGADTLMPRQYGGTDIELLGGAGGWIASAEDLARLVVAIDGMPGMPDILSLEGIQEMTRKGQSRYALGWKGARGNRWWRTGSLSGTNALIYRLDERTTYVCIINRSHWNGYRFNRTLQGQMLKSVNTISEWPTHDLFRLEKLVAIEPYATPSTKGFLR